MQTLGQYQQAQYQAGVASNNETMAKAQAKDAMDLGQQEVLRHYQRVAQLKGTQLAAQGASGSEIGFGSNLAAEAGTTAGAGQDAQTIANNAARQKWGLTVSGQNYAAQAAAARSQGQMTLIAGGLNMGSTALGGAQQSNLAFKQYGRPSWMGKASA